MNSYSYHEIVDYLLYYIKQKKSALEATIIRREKIGDREHAVFAKGALDELLTIEHDINQMLGRDDDES